MDRFDPDDLIGLVLLLFMLLGLGIYCYSVLLQGQH